ncbi:MAG: hypothetical protein KAU20_01725 [Nanoarchaeota archaeon]|nr:hypothetical protein [Nanoarchaeota archaeon]
MVATWAGSTYTIQERDYPDSPIAAAEIDGGDYLRTDAGVLYNPVIFSFDKFSFIFTNITLSILDKFKDEIFLEETGFELADPVWGTVNVIPVPGSFSFAYSTKNNHSFSFSVEERGY